MQFYLWKNELAEKIYEFIDKFSVEKMNIDKGKKLTKKEELDIYKDNYREDGGD